MNIKGRLFTFGCSMTKYYYPTWADILGRSWSYYENWGMAGSGNHFIFNSIFECDKKNKLTSDDTVIVMWTSLARLDTYQFDHWVSNIKRFPKDKDLNLQTSTLVNCPRGYEIQSYGFMYAIEQFLLNKKIKYIPTTWTNYDIDTEVGNLYFDTIKNIKKIQLNIHTKKFFKGTYQSRDLTEWESFYNKISGISWPSWEKFLSEDYTEIDDYVNKELINFRNLMNKDQKLRQSIVEETHPTPTQHIDIAKQMITGFTPESETMAWIQNIEKKLNEGTEVIKFDQHLPHRL